MHQELKDKWIAALRSGEYKQGGGALCINGRHCVIGVLCEVACLRAVPPAYTGYTAYGKYGQVACVPEELLPELTEEVIDTLVMLNDTERKTFPEIADYIEANL